MMDLILLFIGILVVVLLFCFLIMYLPKIFFKMSCETVKIFKDCTEEEAQDSVRDFVERKLTKNNHDFEYDPDLIDEIWESVETVIGDKQYQQLENLSKTLDVNNALLMYKYSSGLPYIAITVSYSNNDEKMALETVLVNIIKKYLRLYGNSDFVLVDWKSREDLKLPCLKIRYAKNHKETRIINKVIANERASILFKNSQAVDDTEEDDLIE